MQKNIIDTALMAAGLLLLYYLKKAGVTDHPDALFMVFGMGLFISYLAGKILKSIGFPAITSYLIMGVVMGPYIMHIFTMDVIKSVGFINNVALSLIGLVAGGEINLRNSRINLGKVMIFVVVQIILTFAFFYSVLSLAGAYLAPLVFSSSAALIFMSVIANAKSPSTTVAVILETESKGRLTDYTLTSAILKDFIIIILFTTILSIYAGDGNSGVGAVIMEEVISSIVGAALGFVVILYLKHVQQNKGTFILLFTVIMTWVAQSVHLNPLLMFLFMGIAVKNLSIYGESLVDIIEENAGIIYLVFFFIAGTVINIPALEYMWAVAVVIVILRLIALYIGCFVAGAVIKETKVIKHMSFLGFIGQAGVSIGFANIIGNTFPDWGSEFRTLVLAIVAINQIIGPLGFKLALRAAGEDSFSRTKNIKNKLGGRQ